MSIGVLACTREPNFELLSFNQNFPLAYERVAWNLETEISEILISDSWPLPTRASN